jgi:hypothetical protein
MIPAALLSSAESGEDLPVSPSPASPGVRRLLPVLAALAVAGPASAAGRAPELYYEQTTVTSSAGEPAGAGVLSRVWFAGRRMRMESGGAAGGPALILRLDTNTAWRLDPAEKVARQVDLESLRAQTRMDAALAGELMGAGEPGSVRTRPLPGKTVAGYACRGWRLRAGSAVLDVYTTTAVPVSMAAYAEFLEWTGAAEAMAGLWDEMRALPGFPLETRAEVNVLGEVHETRSTVTRLKVAPVPASTFEPPRGYRVLAEEDEEPAP